MANRWVVNASPIIALAKIEQVNLLLQLCDELVIPQGVAAEIQSAEHEDAATLWIRGEGKQYVHPSDNLNPAVSSWDLGLGESHVLSWVTTHSEFEAIIDDRAARKAAVILGIPVRGTVSVIVLAKQKGYVASARKECEKLIDVGLRISSDVLAKAIALAGE